VRVERDGPLVILRVLRGVRRRLLGGPPPGDYRAYLFEELVAYLERRLADLVKPGGVLVLESATTRRPRLRAANCVEVLYPPSEKVKRRYHVSMNITHLPSARALESWLAMVGLARIVRATCHRRVSRDLALARAAYLATRPLAPTTALYYALAGDEGYEVGKSL
jgi:hypothetical protein